jgi:hypothetical protein
LAGTSDICKGGLTAWPSQEYLLGKIELELKAGELNFMEIDLRFKLGCLFSWQAVKKNNNNININLKLFINKI